MLDRDLAALYGVETRVLNQAVRRHGARFPPDFMFKLTAEETRNWKSQIVTSNPGLKMGHRKPPHAFTEQGVAMLSSVPNSERAIQANIAIIRAFIRLRRALSADAGASRRLERVEAAVGEHERELAEHAAGIHEAFAAIRSIGRRGVIRRGRKRLICDRMNP